MSLVVVDASIMLDAFTAPKASEAFQRARQLLTEIQAGQVRAAAPEHFSIEVASGALKFQRRHRDQLSAKDVLGFLKAVDAFPINLCSIVVNADLVASWALAMNCGAYDAVYVQLARQLDAQVATSDRGMRAACLGFNVALWEPQ